MPKPKIKAENERKPTIEQRGKSSTRKRVKDEKEYLSKKKIKDEKPFKTVKDEKPGRAFKDEKDEKPSRKRAPSPPTASSKDTKHSKRVKLDVPAISSDVKPKKSQSSKTDRLPPSKTPDDRLELLNADAIALVEHLRPTDETDALRERLFKRSKAAIKKRWPKSPVYMIGSTATGAYISSRYAFVSRTHLRAVSCAESLYSDKDVNAWVWELPDWDKALGHDKPTHKALSKVLSVLIKADIAVSGDCIDGARIPVIHANTAGEFEGCTLDVTLNGGSGPSAVATSTKLLDEYAFDYDEDRPRFKTKKAPPRRDASDFGVARSLVVLVKHHLTQRKLFGANKGGLGGYAFLCLVVSFLQHHEAIQSGEMTDPAANLGELLLDFFELYGEEFDYDNDGISVKGSGPLFDKSTRKFSWQRDRRKRNDRRWEYMDDYAIDEDIARQHKDDEERCLCIEHPNRTYDEVARATHRMPDIVDAFVDSAETLRDAINSGGSSKAHSFVGSVLGGVITFPCTPRKRKTVRV